MEEAPMAEVMKRIVLMAPKECASPSDSSGECLGQDDIFLATNNIPFQVRTANTTMKIASGRTRSSPALKLFQNGEIEVLGYAHLRTRGEYGA